MLDVSLSRFGLGSQLAIDAGSTPCSGIAILSPESPM